MILATGTDEDGALGAYGHGVGVGHAGGEDLDLKAVGDFHFGEGQAVGGGE